MFQNAGDVAQAALDLIELARDCVERGQLNNSARVELSAAALAVHVADWHALPSDLRSPLRERFRSFSPEWSILKDIVNGVKHPLVQPGPHQQREPEWEDNDFWETAGIGPTLCVHLEGRWRSVRALTIKFCTDYLSRSHEIDYVIDGLVPLKDRLT